MTRRDFARIAAAAAACSPVSAERDPLSLDGEWLFRLDPGKAGEREGWNRAATSPDGWRPVRVPHTWQTEHPDHLGAAWYRRDFDVPRSWAGKTVRVGFEAVYHTADVWVNGQTAGRHPGRGYTAFAFDITRLLKAGQRNSIVVRADNAFDPDMLPRSDSYDWTPDGGITRPVRLLVTPAVYIERIEVDAEPEADGSAALQVRVVVQGTNRPGRIEYSVTEDSSGLAAAGGSSETPSFRVTFPKAKLWHFDRPSLYTFTARLGEHSLSTTFGVRRIEVKGAGLYLNGERVWLAGVERMAGSHPKYGMAEPSEWIEHDHRDMKELNCVFTRVHWPQDRRVLDYCDRHGILIQLEVPSWGAGTFKGMTGEPSAAIVQNGLEQLREQIARDRNHPSIIAWGLCNEVNGQNPVAQKFVRRMAGEARKLDPHRLLTYASNSLQTTPEKDVAGELDFISWNDYYESWYKGTPADLRRNLEAILKAFPGKVVVISEYGYCECTPDRVSGDPRRIEILREHNRIFRDYPQVGGLIFFSYNDYRTHIGDKGAGVMKQRVHGVVDLYGERKPSFEHLAAESSPVEEVTVTGGPPSLQVKVRTRRTIPAYTLEGYFVRAVVYGFGGLPMDKKEIPLARLAPGSTTSVAVSIGDPAPRRVRIEVVRPTGFVTRSAEWLPR